MECTHSLLIMRRDGVVGVSNEDGIVAMLLLVNLMQRYRTQLTLKKWIGKEIFSREVLNII